MQWKELYDKAAEKLAPRAVSPFIEAGGVAAALVGAKVAKSPKTRELCVAGMAKGMKLQQDARVTLQNMKEDAQDRCAEAKQKAAQETAEEA